MEGRQRGGTSQMIAMNTSRYKGWPGAGEPVAHGVPVCLKSPVERTVGGIVRTSTACMLVSS